MQFLYIPAAVARHIERCHPEEADAEVYALDASGHSVRVHVRLKTAPLPQLR